jgi:hypothetical protein
MGIKQVFVNRSGHTREVELVMANGTIDSMNLQPGGRATPPAGSKINPAKEASYKAWLVVHAIPTPDTADDTVVSSGESGTQAA